MLKNTLLVTAILITLGLQARAQVAMPSARVQVVSPSTEFIAGHSKVKSVSMVNDLSGTFTARNGANWTQRIGGPTGDFRRIWGQGIEVNPAAMNNAFVAEKVGSKFWHDNGELLAFGVTPDDLELQANVLWRDIRFVSYRHVIGGLPVLGTGCFIAIKADKIVMIGVNTFGVNSQKQPFSGSLISLEYAQKTVTGTLAALGILDASIGVSNRAVFPLIKSGRAQFVPVHTVQVTSQTRGGNWTAYVNSDNGELVALRDERIFWDGIIQLEHHDVNPGGDLISGPAKHINAELNGLRITTDADGRLSTSDAPAAVSMSLQGPYFLINNDAGDGMTMEISQPQDGQTIVWQSDGSEYEQAQLDAFMFTSQAREHAKEICGDLQWFDSQMTVNVNRIVDMSGDGNPNSCNAFFDGTTLNFLPAGAMGSYECNNTAMISDVIFHEYGHAVHLNSIIPGVGSFNEATSEGFADTMAVSITGDTVIGRYFAITGEGLRDVEPDKIWPEDEHPDPHQTGLIVGGALWDLRTLLKEEFGEEEGSEITDLIYAGAMRTATEVPSLYESAMLADDDNGDLSDGTPHACQIFEAFAAHGLVADNMIDIAHEPLSLLQPETQLQVKAQVELGNEDCSDLGDVQLIYSIDGGTGWQELEMIQGSDGFETTLPELAEGTSLLYRIEAKELNTDALISKPANRAEPFYRAYVGQLEEIVFYDLETDNGWIHEAVTGIDDWELSSPQGQGGDPQGAFSQDNAWGNNLKLQNSSMYPSNSSSQLHSPTWDLSGYETVRLQFRRWLTVEDGYFDQAKIYVNDEEVWSNTATPGEDMDPHTLHHVDKEWMLFDLDISQWAAGNDQVQITWELVTDGGLEMGGWNIDDVALYTQILAADDDTDTDSQTDDDTDIDAQSVSGCSCNAVSSSDSSLLTVLFSLF